MSHPRRSPHNLSYKPEGTASGWGTTPSGLISMTLPHPAPINNILNGILWRHTVQMLAERTTILPSYKPVPDQWPISPKAFNCKYRRIRPSRLGDFLKLSLIIRQSSRRALMCRQCIHQSYSDTRRVARTNRATFKASPSKCESSYSAAVASSHQLEITMASNT